MKSAWQTWLVFFLCAALAVAAMAWLTNAAIRADLARTNSARQAELEQKVSLVLWRMDTKLAPLIAEEVARPVEFFRSRSGVVLDNTAFPEGGRIPATVSLPDNVLLNFNCPSDGQCTSPQVPNQLWSPEGATAQDESLNRLNRLNETVRYDTLLDLVSDGSRTTSADPPISTSSNPFAGNRLAESQSSLPVSQGKGRGFQQRASRYEDVTKQQLRIQSLNAANAPATPSSENSNRQQSRAVIEGVSRPVWVGDNLLLARRVSIDGRIEVQGSWLDWPGIRKDLLEEAADLLPDAALEPVRDTSNADPTRMLAGLPVTLIVPTHKLISLKPSAPMQWALWIGWLSLLFALAVAALLLAGVMSLSERRAAFVSSVTHELRTPLTTFRMYSDLLARGMVPDEQRRQEYVETLRREAERLTHLVENVLSYARLERGRKVDRTESISVEQLVTRLSDRLSDRAHQAGMELELEIPESVTRQILTTDVGAVEQILFNLVDNACKYASATDDRRLHWEAASYENRIVFVIRDHGPGFDKPEQAHRSSAFSKTSEEAASSAPGVGLGLALCRNLAKQLGGRLEITDSPQGTTASLQLPV